MQVSSSSPTPVAARFTCPLLVLLGVAVLTACEVGDVAESLHDRALAGIDSIAYEDIHDDPIIVDVTGPMEVDVESFNGDVVVEVNDELDHGIVTFTREATHGYGRTEEAARSLADISASMDITGGELGQVLMVRTSTEHAEPHFQRVKVKIELPEVEGLRVRTRNGGVRAVGISGPIDIETDDGDVRVMTYFAIDDPVTIVNHSGDIDLRIRGESMGELDFQALRGRVFSRVKYGRLRVHPGTDHDTFLATFNDGVNPIVLRTADGDVRFAVVADPMAVGQFIFP